MSAPARWIIAITCLLFAGGLVSLPWTMPLAAVRPMGIAVVSGFLLIIVVACLSGPFQAIAGRVIAISIFAFCVCYIVSEIGKPLPTLRTYRRSDTNLVNAILAFCSFGLPAGYFALRGQLPDWTALGRHYRNEPRNDEEEDWEEEAEGEDDTDEA